MSPASQNISKNAKSITDFLISASTKRDPTGGNSSLRKTSYVYTHARFNREISLAPPKAHMETSKVKTKVNEGRATGGDSQRER